jgi:hypothetical protein
MTAGVPVVKPVLPSSATATQRPAHSSVRLETLLAGVLGVLRIAREGSSHVCFAPDRIGVPLPSVESDGEGGGSRRGGWLDLRAPLAGRRAEALLWRFILAG